MSSEVCPFCGRWFKRLKSHLPHCKAAKHEAPEDKPAATLPPETEGNKHELERAARAKTGKKTAAKVSGKIQTAAKISPPFSAPLTSKHKTNIHKSSQKHEQGLLESVKEMTRSVSKQNDTGSKSEKPDSERQILIPATKTAIEKKSLNAKRTTVSKKKDDKGFSTNKTGSTKAKFTVNNETYYLKCKSWTENKNGVKSLSEIEPWNKRETRITLEDVRTTLKRAKQSGKSKKDSLVDKIEILDQNEAENALAKVQKEQPTRLTALESRRNEIATLESHKNEIAALESRQNEIAASESHKNEIAASESRQNEIAVRKSDNFLCKLAKIENKDCSFFTLRSGTLGDGLRMDRHSGGRAAGWSPAHTLLEAEVLAEAFKKDSAPLLKPKKNAYATEETTSDATTRDGGRRARGERHQEGYYEALAQRRLGQVTLRELPDWLLLKSPRRPGDVMVAAQRGWQWYYQRYIDVKRGRVGGVAMLLAGYCVLSYVWTRPHLTRDRWRKYH